MYLNNRQNVLLIGVCTCAIMMSIRLGVALHPYSGFNKPPMYGDYEAQRHWMEITYNLHPSLWYKNTSNNNLQYWGLDYPPLTAYHSWLCGYLSHHIDSEWVELKTSRGFENADHKLFMRYSVLIGDCLVYFPAIFAFVFAVYHKMAVHDKLMTVSLMLLCPSLIAIDHGHFQYNSISLGLFVWAVVASISGHDLVCCVMFSLALNFKQMELYHAVPFFCFLLGKALQNRKQWFIEVLKFGICVLATFLICWIPFLTSLSDALQVLHRIFPFARGIFEDKVASFWCSVSTVVKLKNIFSVGVLAQISLLVTLVSLIPAAVDLVLRPSSYRFLLSLVNCSLSFFLFSFQVHEKSVLLAAIPVTLLLPVHPWTSIWFNIIATLSMYPLLVKDGLTLVTWSVLGLFCLSCLLLSNIKWESVNLIWKVTFCCSIMSLVVPCILSHFISPPSRYPDIYPVLISGLSCIQLIGFLLFFNFTQLKLVVL